MPWEDEEVREHVARTEALLSRLGELPDNAARAQAVRTLQAMAALYGECLARVMEHADGALTEALAADELVGHLLLVHDAHPHPVRDRLERALAPLQGVELAELDGTWARVTVTPSGCGSSAQALEETARQAVAWAAPEVDRVEVVAASPRTVIPVDALFAGAAAQDR
jgi:hypothetical protein